MEIKYDVFISYSRQDRKVAEGVCGFLESNGLRCFIDYRDIPRTAVWARVIPDALRSSGMMVAIFSAHYNESLQVERELSIADKAHIPVLPFRLADIPFVGMKSYYFESINWLDAFPDPEKMFGSLLTDILALKTSTGDWLENRDLMPSVTHKISIIEENINCEVEEPHTAYDPDLEDDYQDGVDAMRNHEYGEAVDMLLESSYANYKDSQRYISWMMDRDTIGMVPMRLWPGIRKMAEKGNAFAQYLMSRYCSMIDVDSSLSFEYASLSARQGCLYGRFALAKLYELGEGVEADDALGIEKLKELERVNFPLAMREMAREYICGFTLRKNYRRGIRILERGLQNNFAECAYELGDEKLRGIATDYNLDEGRALLASAFDSGFPNALETLAFSYCFDSYKNEMITDVESRKKCLDLLNKGIRIGDPICMYSLGWLYRYAASDMGLKNDEKIAEKWCRKAVEYYHRGAANLLGDLYYYGKDTIEENEQEAWKWYKFAAERCHGYAYKQLGVMCLEGYAQEGMTKDDCVHFFEEALYLGGGGAGEAAGFLYRIYAPDDFEKNFPTVANLAKHIDIADCEKDAYKVIEYLRRGVNYDDNLCRYILGCALTDGDRPYADEIEGTEILKMAISTALPCYEAALRLYEIYSEGFGVIADEELAESYLKIAKEHLTDEIFESWNYKPYKGKLLILEAKELSTADASVSELIKAMDCLSKASDMGMDVSKEKSLMSSRLTDYYNKEIESFFPDYEILARIYYGESIADIENVDSSILGDKESGLRKSWECLANQAFDLDVTDLKEISCDLKANAIELTKCWRMICQKAKEENIPLDNLSPFEEERILDKAENLLDTFEDWGLLLISFVECNLDLKETLTKASYK